MESIDVLIHEPVQTARRPRGLAVSSEWAVYLALLLLALVLRLAELDTVPITPPEARQALAAWRVAWPDAAGPAIIPESPLLFGLHTLSFSTLGGSEFAARVWTALAGAALALTPALFRGLIERIQALVFSAILVCSPALLVASRFDSPLVWTLLLAVVGLWAGWRFWETQVNGYALLATTLLVGAALLTDPTGPLFVLILLGGALFALWVTGRQDVETDTLATVRDRLRAWPWQRGLLIVALVAALISTLLMLHPIGLSTISELLGAGARGIVEGRPGLPGAFPLLVALFYEPALLVFGFVGAVWLLRRGTYGPIELFLLGWAVFGALAVLVYAGGEADHALWFLLPLAGLTALTIVELMRLPTEPLWESPDWAKWLLALAAVALLLVLAVHGQRLSRSLLASPDGSLQLNAIDSISAVWVLIAPIFAVIGFFLASSVWGMTTAVQGSALGVLIFCLVTALSSGWNVAVPEADNPVELWHLSASDGDTALLRATLIELAQRESGGFPRMDVVALVPSDGVVAWLLRDYVNTRFITDLSEARAQEIVLLPTLTEPPDLGGSYVGQTFVVRRGWTPQVVRPIDFPVWWLERRTRIPGVPVDAVVLWLRQDIYQGVPFGAG